MTVTTRRSFKEVFQQIYILYFIFSIPARCLWPGRSISPRSCEAVLAHSMTCTFTLAFANMPWRGKLCWWTFMFSHWTSNVLVCASKKTFWKCRWIPWLTSNWNFGNFCDFRKVSALGVVALWGNCMAFRQIRSFSNRFVRCTFIWHFLLWHSLNLSENDIDLI